MKILHILASDRFSGAENVVCQIVGMFKDDPCVEMVYCSPDGQIREALAERGVAFAPIAKLCRGEIRRVIREQRPDVVHAHDMRATFVAALSCGKIPLVSHIHGNFSGLNKLTAKSLAFALATAKAKHIFWVSQSSYDGYVFKGSVNKKSSVLYNVIDVEAVYRKMESDKESYNYDAVFLGRLCYEKDPERLIRVFKLVSEKMNDVKFAVIGSGDYEQRIKELANELGIYNNIDFLGFRSNPLRILHDSKLMIMTSIREGTPICALEALALGVPIVSTPTDGMRDLIVEGENGYLSNDDQTLAEKVFAILNDCELQKKLSEAAQARGRKINDLNNYVIELKKAYGIKVF